MAPQIYKSPNRFLFIVSIGNPAPYTETRHSAGHLLLDAIQSQLHNRIGLSAVSRSGPALSGFLGNGNNNNNNNSKNKSTSSIFYSTWKSPSLMNVSGPPVLRQLKTWLADRKRYFESLVSTLGNNDKDNDNDRAQNQLGTNNNTIQLIKSAQLSSEAGSATTVEQEQEQITIDIRGLTQRFRPTLVILHDELEARPGQIKIRRGGPQQASLRGHKGLISIMDSLRGAGLLASPVASATNTKTRFAAAKDAAKDGVATTLAILRIGVGIGRPVSRERNAVADYVLSKMELREMQALKEAVPQVVEALVQEIYRMDDDER